MSVCILNRIICKTDPTYIRNSCHDRSLVYILYTSEMCDWGWCLGKYLMTNVVMGRKTPNLSWYTNSIYLILWNYQIFQKKTPLKIIKICLKLIFNMNSHIYFSYLLKYNKTTMHMQTKQWTWTSATTYANYLHIHRQ